MQGPVEILAGADAGGLHRRERVEHGAGADWNASGAQRAREIDDVLGEPAFSSFFTSPLAWEVDGRRPSGGGYTFNHLNIRIRRYPPPQPSPARGEGAHHRLGETLFPSHHSAARSSARTSSSSSFALLPSMRAISS